MRSTRAMISAALQSGGGHPIDQLARHTLARVGLPHDADPRKIVRALEYDFMRVHGVTFRAEVHRDDRYREPHACPDCAARGWHEPTGRTITAAWDPLEWGLNVFIGIAIAMFGEASMPATHADVYRLAGAIAMPDGLPSPHLPPWFANLHQRRVWSQTGSGVWRAVH